MPDAPKAAPPARVSLRLLLAPFEAREFIPPEFDAGVERLRRELAAVLRERGHKVTELPQPLFDALWEQSQQSVGRLQRSEPDYRERHAATLARTLELLQQRLGVADGFVVPRIQQRSVAYRGGVARWDGVERRVQVNNVPKGHAVSRNRGEITALTLRLAIYAGDGTLLCEGRGGLDVATDVDVALGRNKPRADALAADGDLRDGVELALSRCPI